MATLLNIYPLGESNKVLSANDQTTGRFKATQLWNEIIENLKEHTEIKRRKHRLKVHENCFTGENVVDVLHSYLTKNREEFKCVVITRDKAVKLAQVLMDNQVFLPIAHASTAKLSSTRIPDFQDSVTHLYRFTDKSISSLTEENPVVLDPLREERKKPLVDEDASEAENNPTRISSEVWRGALLEVVMVRLLHLVEVPVLETLLNTISELNDGQPGLNSNLVIANSGCLDSSYSGIQASMIEDQWLRSAIECLDSLPPQETVSGLPPLNAYTRGSPPHPVVAAVFRVIASHYRCRQTRPLVHPNFLDLLVAVLKLISSRRYCSAVQALQLLVLLLPSPTRRQLHRLLSFMAHTARLTTTRLRKEGDNQTVVQRAFCGSVVNNSLLSKGQAEQLVAFMMDNRKHVFSEPADLRQEVDHLVSSVRRGKGRPSLVNFCGQIQPQQFEEQKVGLTQESIKQLIDGVIDDTNISLKEKKDRLKQLRKHHPEVYHQSFADML